MESGACRVVHSGAPSVGRCWWRGRCSVSQEQHSHQGCWHAPPADSCIPRPPPTLARHPERHQARHHGPRGRRHPDAARLPGAAAPGHRRRHPHVRLPTGWLEGLPDWPAMVVGLALGRRHSEACCCCWRLHAQARPLARPSPTPAAPASLRPLIRYVVSVNWSAEMVRAALAQEGLPVVVAGARAG